MFYAYVLESEADTGHHHIASKGGHVVTLHSMLALLDAECER
jgi:hypothetical protein